MPAPGDQHRRQPAAANPYEDDEPVRISEFTATEIATLASRLDKQLGPEYISTRPGAGGQRVHYLAAEKVINLANEVFGFNGWSSQIKNVQVDFCDEHAQTGRIDVGLAIIVRVTLKDGTYHEDMGYGHIENCKGKAAAFEKARKEAATDALKRTLRTFGNVLGNCLYDKEFLSRVTKVKANPTSKWDPDNLYRHADYAPVKKESELRQAAAQPARAGMAPPLQRQQVVPAEFGSSSADAEDEFGSNIFDEVELTESHSDGLVLPGTSSDAAQNFQGKTTPAPQQRRPLPQSRNTTAGHVAQPRPNGPRIQQQDPIARPNSTPPNAVRPAVALPPDFEPPVGFVTGRAANALVGDAPPPQSLAALQPFNPAAESPSIRKTQGVQHNSSKPVSRSMLNGTAAGDSAAAPGSAATPAPQRSFTNPAADATRRIGMPPQPQSPMVGRNGYRVPTAAGVKRPATVAPTPERAPLADVSNTAASSGGMATTPGDASKRARVGEADVAPPAMAASPAV